MPLLLAATAFATTTALPAPQQSLSCAAALESVCSAQRGDPFACAECAGKHQQQLQQAGCDNKRIGVWCSGVSIAPFAGSQLVTPEWATQLEEWVTAAGPAATPLGAREPLGVWALCYSTFLHPATGAGEFHSRCDGFNETLTVGNNSLGFTFGGFATESWAGTGYKNEARGDWIFRLGPSNATQYMPLGRASHPGKGDDFQFAAASHWPEWGGGGDLRFGHDGVPGTMGTCNQGFTYQGANHDACGGGYNWGATQLEVWHLLT